MLKITITIIVIVIGSALFSSAETAFSNLQLFKLESAQKEKKSKLRSILIKLKKDQISTLTIILVMNNIVNIGGTAFATVLFRDELGTSGIYIGTVIMTVSIIFLGEIIPKTFATSKPLWFANISIMIIYPLFIIFKPISLVISLFNKGSEPTTTEKELKQLVDTISTEGVLEKEESDMIRNALDFDDILVKNVMRPASDVDGFSAPVNYAGFKKFVQKTSRSRIPIFKNSKPIGLLLVIDFFKKGSSTSNLNDLIIKDVPWLKTKTNLHDALIMFKTTNVHMAFVKNSKNEYVGIVTVEDLVEQIVGDIYDETDIDKMITHIGHNKVSVKADAKLSNLYNNYWKIRLPETKCVTVRQYLSELNSGLDLFEGLKIKQGELIYQIKSLKGDWRITISKRD